MHEIKLKNIQRENCNTILIAVDESTKSKIDRKEQSNDRDSSKPAIDGQKDDVDLERLSESSPQGKTKGFQAVPSAQSNATAIL